MGRSRTCREVTARHGARKLSLRAQVHFVLQRGSGMWRIVNAGDSLHEDDDVRSFDRSVRGLLACATLVGPHHVDLPATFPPVDELWVYASGSPGNPYDRILGSPLPVQGAWVLRRKDGVFPDFTLKDLIAGPLDLTGTECAKRMLIAKIRPDMSRDDFHLIRLLATDPLVGNLLAEVSSVLDIPEWGRSQWLDLVSISSWQHSFWDTVQVGYDSVPDISTENAEAITRFVDSRAVAPFRRLAAKQLEQSIATQGLLAAERLVRVKPDRITRTVKNPVSERQRRLAGRGEPLEVESMGDALAHWQYVGNYNIQSLLRDGRLDLPFSDPRFAEIVARLAPQLPRTTPDETPEEAVTRFFEQQAQNSVRYLDDFVAGSDKHGGFTGFRGTTAFTAMSVLGIGVHDLDPSSPDHQDVSSRRLVEELTTWDWTGCRISDAGYSAVSLSPDRASGFATTGTSYQTPDGSWRRSSVSGVVFQIDVPESTPAGSVSGTLDSLSPSYNREYEMLLPRGTEFEVTSVVTDRQFITYNSIDAIIRLRPVGVAHERL